MHTVRHQVESRPDTTSIPMIVHDIKNPLSAALALIEWIDQTGDTGVLASVQEYIEHAIEVTDALKELEKANRYATTELSPSDVSKHLVKTLDTFRFRLRHQQIDCRIETDDKDAYPVPMEPGQLDRVLYNLVDNACDAMPDGGTLVIAIGSPEPGAVFLSVMDTGMGLGPEAAKHLGRPYYTTKTGGHGLGVAGVANLVSSSGGNLSFRSARNHGTEVTIYWQVEGSEGLKKVGHPPA